MYVMIPTFPYYLSSSSSSPSPMPIDLNIEHHNHDLVFSPIYQPSSSNSSLSNPTLFNPSQNHAGSSYWEPKNLQTDHEEAGKVIVSSGSWDDPAEEKCERKKAVKLKVWKKRSERENQNHQGEDTDSKWMSSKMRMMRKIVVSDQKGSDIPPAGTCEQKFEDENKKQQPLLSPQGTDNNSSSNSSSTHSSSDNYHDNNTNNNSNITVRVCADCHTTKTPLWRSGPRGPKSLCNACGIRQRKARRAMAAAVANGLALAAETSPAKGNYKFQSKEKKSKTECESHESLKKKRKLDDQAKPASRGRVKKFNGFEDFRVSLSKKLAPSQVFPQDEKEAAILLMALSYNGLVHG